MSLRAQLLPIALIAIGSLSSPAEASCSVDGCVLVWADEFDGNAVDTNKWEFMTGNGGAYGLPGWGNNELQYYRPQNAVVANGELTITAKQESFGGQNYTSARLRTLGRGDWTYGRFEMRARQPVGQGMWPAFWMLPSDFTYGTWASSGEIDIMETVGSNPELVLGTIHYGGQFPDNVYSSSSFNLPTGTATDFHVYAVEWEEGEIRWYIDDVLFSTRSNWYSTGGPFPAPFDVDFHLLLNLAVGGNLPGNPDGSTVFPQDYVIDYVRVYQWPADIAAPRRVFDDMEHGNPFDNGWFAFGGAVGGGGLDANGSDLPPANGGNVSLQTGWGSGGTPGYFGGFGRYNPMDITADLSEFRMWINPDAGQDYTLEINLLEDDNSDGQGDDEFQFNCRVSPTGPCAIAGGGWQLVAIGLDNFFDDNSFHPGGNGILDAISPANGGNGELIEMVVAVIGNSGSDATFRTDYWSFFGELSDTDEDGVADVVDNCTDIANASQTDSNGDSIGNACDTDIGGPAGSDDCIVNFIDLALMQQAFFSTAASPNWNPDADFTGPAGATDGIINFVDLARMQDTFFSTPGPSGLLNDCS